MKQTRSSNSLRAFAASILALISMPAALHALPIITDVVETGGDDEATDTVTAKWTGITFVNGVANEPVPGAAGDSYTVGLFGEEAPMFVDRNHQWNGATTSMPLPRYLVGGEYIMSGNDNRDNPDYQLEITISEEADVYMLVDDRLADNSNANPPNDPDWQGDADGDGLPDMGWLLEQGWVPVKTGLNRFGNPDWPDHVGADEGADGVGPGAGINQWSSVYVKRIPAGKFTILAANNPGRNMYGVVVKAVPKRPTLTKSVGDLLGFELEITDASDTALNTNTIAIKLNGASITPQIVTKEGAVTRIQFTAPSPLPAGSTQTVEISFSDTGTPPSAATETFSYTVENYVTIPASYALPSNSANTSAPGFKVRSVQARADAGLVNTVSRALSQLAGTLIDPDTNQPFENEAVLDGAVGGYVNEPDVINYDEAADHGNFTSANNYPEDPVPGIPGIGGHTDNYAVEILTYLELPAGIHTFGVNSDDGFALFTGPDARDVLAPTLGQFNGGRGAADSTFTVITTVAGIYPFRLVWFEGGGDSSVEWFSIDASGKRILINDRQTAGAIRAWREVTAPGKPYVSSVSPAPDSTGVKVTSNIEIKITDGSLTVPASAIQLALNGNTVTPQINKAGAVTTITFDPPGDLAGNSTHTVQLVFGDSATPSIVRTNTFSFFTERPPSNKPAYQQDNTGLVVMESENFHAATVASGHSWEFQTERADFSGEGYMQALPDSGGSQPNYPDFLDLSPRLDFKVRFTQAGTHYIWIRGGDPVAGGAGDSVHAGINGDTLDSGIRIDGSPGFGTSSWNWVGNIQGNTRAMLEVPSAGEHTVNVWMREDGFLFDKIIIASSETFTPTGTGPAESIRVGQAPPPTVSITSPTSGARFAAGAAVTIDATAAASPGHTISKVEFFAGEDKLGEDTTSPYSFTVPNAPAGRYTLTARATDSQGLTTTSAGVSVTVGDVADLAVFFVADPNNMNPADSGVRTRLQALGFEVKAIDDNNSATSDADGASLIITSSTVSSGNIGDKFRTVPVPVVNWEQALQDNYMMTGDTGSDRGETADPADQTQINIINANHPLAAGLPAGLLTIATNPVRVTWGNPNENAVKITTLADDVGNQQVCLYGYDTGATMIDGTFKAPARRVHIFFQDTTYANLNADGQKLFDAAISWAVNRTLGVQPKFNPPTLQGGNMILSWTGGGTLQSADSVTGPWTNVANATSPHTVTITGGSKFYRLQQ